jgi:hypothetical protein
MVGAVAILAARWGLIPFADPLYAFVRTVGDG